MIKLLIGGSPCTFWSIAQKNNRETEAKGLGWELFKNYLVAKEKFKPDFFLYENNKSAAQAIKDQIKQELIVYDGTLLMEDSGARYIEINSALVSAQNRQRFYVHNCGDVGQPEDRGILLKDILETTVAEPIRIPPYGVPDKARPIEALYANHAGTGEGSLEKRLFSDNPNKQQNDLITEPIRVGALPRPNGELSTSQAMRVYSVDGKGVTQSAGGGGMGGKTGLYAVPIGKNIELVPYVENKIDEIVDKYGYLPEMFNPYNCAEITDKHPTFTASSGNRQTNSGSVFIIEKVFIDGKEYTVYEVKDGQITIKGKQYPIKLPDGYYIIRKLTVTECERLQTMPDGYTSKSGVSASQCYKGLGNGWTAEVIKHILSNALKDIPKDEEIVVLSMYDGIGTGRYCLDKMGFTNVKYFAYEIDKYAMQIAKYNYPDIIEMGDAFAVNHPDWTIGY